MYPGMVFQITFLCKLITTLSAKIHLFECMNKNVFFHVTSLVKCFPAYGTWKWLHTCVNLQVILEAAGMGEQCRANVALMCFFTRMGDHVLAQEAVVPEALATYNTQMACIRLIAAVDRGYVIVERSRLSKTFTANAAHVRFFTGVCQLMNSNVARNRKPFIANVTFIRLLTCVGHHVSVEL